MLFIVIVDFCYFITTTLWVGSARYTPADTDTTDFRENIVLFNNQFAYNTKR